MNVPPPTQPLLDRLQQVPPLRPSRQRPLSKHLLTLTLELPLNVVTCLACEVTPYILLKTRVPLMVPNGLPFYANGLRSRISMVGCLSGETLWPLSLLVTIPFAPSLHLLPILILASFSVYGMVLPVKLVRAALQVGILWLVRV